jgi:hypothetical protein
MTGTYTSAGSRTFNVEFSLPDADTAASGAIDYALDFCAAKMKLANSDEALALLRRSSRDVRGYFEYGLAKHLAEYVGALDGEVQAVYLYDDEATPEDVIFGEAAPTLVHLVVWAQRKTGALSSLVVALDRAATQRYAELMEAPEQAHLLDVQVVDSTEVNSRSGFGAMLTWLHHRPLIVWKR